jgi:tetratricopeptide (TPR) repeat protein
MKCDILASTENMRIDYYFDDNLYHKNLAYVFSPSMNRNLDGNAYGGEVFARNGFDVIAFKVTNDDWFQSIPFEIFEKICIINLRKGYHKRVSYGSSMGGYASIALSKFLNANTSVSFSPQYSIEENFDDRWKSYAKKIDFKYRITEDTINHNCNFFVFYDGKDKDGLHANKLINILPKDKTKFINLPYTGHPTTHYLSEVGIIKELLIKIAQDNNVDGIDLLARKKQSKYYLQNISINLFKKNHLNWSLSAIDSALKIDSKMASFYRHKSDILNKMRRVDDAIVCISEAIAIEPNNAHLLGHLSNIYLQNNRMEDALSVIDSALKVDPTIVGLYRQKSGILDKIGRLDEAIQSINEATALDPNNPNYAQYMNYLSNKKINS